MIDHYHTRNLRFSGFNLISGSLKFCFSCIHSFYIHIFKSFGGWRSNIWKIDDNNQQILLQMSVALHKLWCGHMISTRFFSTLLCIFIESIGNWCYWWNVIRFNCILVCSQKHRILIGCKVIANQYKVNMIFYE